ncbi:hypothetical protein FACS1894127_3180 [Clostridia bacterium]|nr:hypothetical protein FACS1894127_3180 [Clostridia bacterium]
MATTKLITEAKLKKILPRLSQDEMIGLVTEMSAKITSAREFLTIRFGEIASETEICEKYKAIIENEYFPKRGLGRASTKVAKAAIADFKKVCSDKALYIDILLFYVEQCVEFTDTYGDIDEPFYNSAESVYAQAVKEINVTGYNVYSQFAKRLRDIVANACKGWYFQGSLQEIHDELLFLEDEDDADN